MSQPLRLTEKMSFSGTDVTCDVLWTITQLFVPNRVTDIEIAIPVKSIFELDFETPPSAALQGFLSLSSCLISILSFSRST